VKTLTDTLEQLLHSRHYDRHRNSFVRAILTDATPQLGAMDRLRDRFPFALELEQQVFAKQSMLDVDRLEELRGRSDEAVIQEYVKEVFPKELDKHATRFVNDTVRAVLTGDQA
jgi:exonuclease SbcD